LLLAIELTIEHTEHTDLTDLTGSENRDGCAASPTAREPIFTAPAACKGQADA
jgi:hypothetical protein